MSMEKAWNPVNTIILLLMALTVSSLGAQEDELWMGAGMGMDVPLPDGWTPGMPLFSGIVSGARGRHEVSFDMGFGSTDPGDTDLEPYEEGLYILFVGAEYRYRLARFANFLTPCVTAGTGLALLSWDNYGQDDQDDRESLMIPVIYFSAGFAVFAEMPPFTRIGLSCAPCLFISGHDLFSREAPAPEVQFGLRLTASITFRITDSVAPVSPDQGGSP
jgi:hypothetical protein